MLMSRETRETRERREKIENRILKYDIKTIL